MNTLHDRMKSNAKSVNKYLTDEILDAKGAEALLNNTHPLERDGFHHELEQGGFIEKQTQQPNRRSMK